MAQNNKAARGGGAVDADEIDLQIADNAGVAEIQPSESEYEEEESEEEGVYDDEDDQYQEPQAKVETRVTAPQQQINRTSVQAAQQKAQQPQAQAQARGSARGAQAPAKPQQQQKQQQQRNSAQSDSARQREADILAAREQEQRRKQKEEEEKRRAQQQTKERLPNQRDSQAMDAKRQQDAKAKLISEKQQRAAQEAIASRMGSLEDETAAAGGRESSLGLMNKNRSGGQQSPDHPFKGSFASGPSLAEGTQPSLNSLAAAPTAGQYRLTTEFFDLTYKFLTLLNSLSEIFRVTSFVEMLLFFVAIIFFFVGEDRSVWFGVLALFHVARAFMGLAMGRVIPSSYDFVEKLEFNGAKQLVFANVKMELGVKVKMLICDYYDDFERLALMYTVLALITTTLDIISFFAVYGILAGRIGEIPDNISDDAIEVGLTPLNSHLGRILVVMLYTFCDIVYILWILHFQMRLGVDERKYALRALLGKGDDMRIAFGMLPKKKGYQGSGSGSANQRQNDLPKNKPGQRSRQNRE